MKKIISLSIALAMLLSMFTFLGVYAAEEVLISDSFENGLGSDWTVSELGKTNITVETSTAADGKKSLLFNDDTEATAPILYSKKVEAAGGDVFELSASFKQVEGSKTSVFYKFYDDANKQLTGSGSFNSGDAEWKTVSKTVTAPAGTVMFQIWVTGTIKTLGKTYIDNIKAVRTAKGTGASAAAPAPEEKPATPVAKPDGNIMFSENFENGLSQWTFANDYAESNHKVTTKEFHEGKQALYSVDDSDTKSPIIKSPMIEGKAGEGYKISASFKNESGSNFKIWIKFYDQDGKNQVNGESFGTNKTVWTVVEKTALMPEGSSKMQIWITGVNKNLGATYIDNIFVTKLSAEETEAARPVELPKPEVIEGIPASSENFHIYLCIGQSNMVGADTVKKEDMVKVDGAYLYNTEGKWEVAQPYPYGGGAEYMGFNRYSTVSPGSGRMGPTVGFARGMAKNVPAGVKVGIISNAIGGTTVQEWSKGYGQAEDLPLMDGRPDRNLYEEAVKRTKEALEKGGVLKGIFYLQGESCAAKAGYMDRLAKIGDGIREDIGVSVDEVPFFVSEIPQVRASGVKVIRTAPEHIKNCYVISSEGLTIFDSIHFDADSQRKLGLRFAEMALSKVYGITASADDMYKAIYGDKVETPKVDDAVYTILVNGKKLEADVPPVMAADRLFVPLRAIFEALGAEVSWDDPTQTVTGKRAGTTVIMQIGDEHMTVNGVQTKMGIAPMLKDSRTLVPVRFVGEGLGATVGWDEKTNTATIDLK